MSGQLIFVPDEKNAWVPAKVLEVKKGKYVKVQTNPLMGGGKEKKVEGNPADFETVLQALFRLFSHQCLPENSLSITDGFTYYVNAKVSSTITQ